MMSQVSKYVFLIMAFGAFASSMAEARLKKVPIGEATVIKPSETKFKKIETKKLEKKKARLEKKGNKADKRQVLDMEKIPAAKLASMIENAESIEILAPETESENAVAVAKERAKDQETALSKQKRKTETKPIEAKVDRLSEAAPDQVEIEKEKKKKRTWKWWKKRGKQP